ncbi:membrane protein insertase YidC [Methylophilus aquaticus]|uniref:Membrane protein insertase YidC n=1 Tax=Methylophilus aquaticus TaxID=1971610 RepID=A0ABT9JNQ5_9PROT|nr:membrane protein insertase YidC [Methylophilus aquaticus]MDP8566241.1 membrane protein insertase YidC [Methylophilus aquaticus]
MDTRRLILFVIFSFSIMLLWDAWQQQHTPQPAATNSQPALAAPTDKPQAAAGFNLRKGERIQVKTDRYAAEIDTTGGDLRQLSLLEHKADDNSGPYELMTDQSQDKLYVAQTGLKGDGLPTHYQTFTAAQSIYAMQDGQDTLEVRLSSPESNGIAVDKIYVFHRGQYVIDVRYEIKNNSDKAISPSVYYQIIHDNQSNQGSKMMPTFTGGAYYTVADKYNKVKFDEMAKQDVSINAKDGWVGLVQHYFVSAWIPQSGNERKFYTTKLSEHDYSIGAMLPVGEIAAGSSKTVDAKLFSGPQVQQELEATAPGLEYVVDYGILTIIAKPLMWLLSHIHELVKNWGVAIIILTIMIKAAFFKLSASGYRNMAHLREIAPRMQALKDKFGDDKQKLQQAMMEMYRTEKINPMGGCLPILVQIPVFISLYWVLLGSVELRHAPFFGWIHDLSATDPYFVLPLLMGATMIIQTTLNPPPTDPIQAKVMKVMPVLFSVFFFFFPAGLVLYWLVNNILSIWQQWAINRMIHAEAQVKKGHGK